MLEFSKKILIKVSFDKSLFKKELKKSTTWLNKKDIAKLKIWTLISFFFFASRITVSVFRGKTYLVRTCKYEWNTNVEWLYPT